MKIDYQGEISRTELRKILVHCLDASDLHWDWKSGVDLYDFQADHLIHKLTTLGLVKLTERETI